MQNVIACSTEIPWNTIRANYVAKHIFAQILPIENLFEYNSYRKQFADARIHKENLFVLNSQRKQFVDSQFRTDIVHRQNQNVFNAKSQKSTSTVKCDVQVNSAMFGRGNRLKCRQSQTLLHLEVLQAKLLEGYADLREGLTRKRWCSGSSTGEQFFWDDVTFADNQNLSIEILIFKVLEEVQSRKSKGEKRVN